MAMQGRFISYHQHGHIMYVVDILFRYHWVMKMAMQGRFDRKYVKVRYHQVMKMAMQGRFDRKCVKVRYHQVMKMAMQGRFISTWAYIIMFRLDLDIIRY